MNYIALDNKSALNKVKGGFPYKWDLNIYRGCEHGCKYCYALYSHDYLNNTNFFDTIYYKKNILNCLEKELSSKNWKHEVINIGGVTDSYQKIEEKMQLMPEILKLMIKYKNPIIISTKSILILRDINLINELSKIVNVNIAFTITTVDEDLRKQIEPFSSPSIERFKVISKLKKTNASIGIHLMPIIPYLTDNYNNLNAIYRLASKLKVDYVLPGTLYLRGKTKPYFFNFVQNYNYEKYLKIYTLYKQNNMKAEYKKNLYKVIDQLKQKYNISSNYKKSMNKIQK